jgi:stage III sporulation protein AH
MFMSNTKKIIAMTSLVLLLAVTAVLNFVLANTNVENSSTNGMVTAANYFTTYREERTTTRSEELLQLDEIISVSKSDSTEYSDALAMKIELTEMTEKEMLLENLIKAYGFEDVVVVIGLDSDNVNVIAKSENLTTDDAITIYTIIQEEGIASPDNVKIIPIS